MSSIEYKVYCWWHENDYRRSTIGREICAWGDELDGYGGYESDQCFLVGSWRFKKKQQADTFAEKVRKKYKKVRLTDADENLRNEKQELREDRRRDRIVRSVVARLLPEEAEAIGFDCTIRSMSKIPCLGEK
jgi:hypothetical protein